MSLKLLVPLDGSELAECVLPAVENLVAGDKKTHVTFIYVVMPLDVPMAEGSYKKKIESDAKAAASSYLKRLTAKAPFKGHCSSEVLVGKAADKIISYASANKMDIILMATHGRSGIGQWIYGSVAEKVIHGAKIPIWLVKAAGCKLTYKNKELRVMVPLDGSKVAESVLPYLQVMKKEMPHNKLDFILTRVSEIFSPPISYPVPTNLSWDEYLRYETIRSRELCRNYLKGIKSKLAKNKILTRTQVPEGNPAEVLIKYAKKNSIDLIIMSTHGHTGFSKWAFGSIAEKVLKGADCPILLVKVKG